MLGQRRAHFRQQQLIQQRQQQQLIKEAENALGNNNNNQGSISSFPISHTHPSQQQQQSQPQGGSDSVSFPHADMDEPVMVVAGANGKMSVYSTSPNSVAYYSQSPPGYEGK